MKLWLDDRRPAPAGWTRAFSVAEAQALLKTGQIEEASLDHDLGACEGTSLRSAIKSLLPRVATTCAAGMARSQSRNLVSSHDA